MTKRLKLFLVDEKPYLVSLDQINVGDKAIVTVGGQYPNIVDCVNEQVLNLITKSMLTSTQPFKVFLGPEKITLSQSEIDKIMENDGMIVIEIDNEKITYNFL